MKGLSKLEIDVISDLEFRQKYYFTREDIKTHFSGKRQMTNTLYQLRKKERIIRLNRNKYFLVPIKARYSKWTDNPFIIADEICNGKDYFIGGWAAANYWRLTEQVPMQTDVYTIRRQGKFNLLNNRFVFHRTTKKNLKNAVTIKVNNHHVGIIRKEIAKQWMKSK